jgi:hypothetical protein
MKSIFWMLGMILLAGTSCKTSQVLLSESVPSDFQLQIRQTPCFGQCPAYQLQVDANGLVQYEGKSHVELIGKHSKQLSPQKMVALVEVLKSSDFWDYREEYDDPNIMDLPSSLMSCTLDGKTHNVKARVNAPKEFYFLIQTVVNIVGKEDFVATSPSKP